MRKAISINQPWAWSIIYSGKDIENRTWKTKYRGELYIHAGKRFNFEGYRFLQNHSELLLQPIPEPLIQGCIIGKVELVDCVSYSDSPWFFGPYGFVLKNPEPIEPIPLKGRLSIFNF